MKLAPILIAFVAAASTARAADPATSPEPLDLTSQAALNRSFGSAAWIGALQADPEAPADAEEPTAPAEDAPVPFGTKGSWRFQVQIGGGYTLEASNDDTWLVLGGVGFSYFVMENFSLDFEFNGMFVHQPQFDTGGFNFNLLLRWHVLTRDKWSLYFDGGAGLVIFGDKVPYNGSEFNFTPQFGGGVSFEIASNTRMLIGARWHHISNGSLYLDNPGLDSVIGYVTLSFPF